MSKTLVTLNEAGSVQNFVLPNTTSQDVVNLLLSEPANENEIIAKFLNRTGVIVTVQTPASSWVDHVEFDQLNGTLTFVTSNESRTESFSASFEDFLDVLAAPSIGKLYWEFKHGKLDLEPKRG